MRARARIAVLVGLLTLAGSAVVGLGSASATPLGQGKADCSCTYSAPDDSPHPSAQPRLGAARQDPNLTGYEVSTANWSLWALTGLGLTVVRLLWIVRGQRRSRRARIVLRSKGARSVGSGSGAATRRRDEQAARR
jgi:hypothetical protein